MKATLQRVEQPTETRKSYKLTFTDEGGKQFSGVYGNPAYVSAPFEVGHEDEFELESKKGNDGGEYFVLKRWGAPKDSPQRGGGGGGFKAPPRDESIIVAQVCLKGAIDVAIHTANNDTKPRQIDPNEVKALFEEYCDLFPQGYKRLKAAIGA